MENITLGQVMIGLAFLLSLIGNAKSLIQTIKEPIDKKIAKIL